MNATPQRTVTYFEPIESDGWRVEVNQGSTIVRRLAVDTKEDAIAATKQILIDLPGTQFVACDLGGVYAWQEDKRWLYSPEPREDASPARLLDDMGELLLMVLEPGLTIFARDAKRFQRGDGGAKYVDQPVITDEERREYDEIHARIVACLKQPTKGRRQSRWRPAD
jgi:hypothetical protein